MSLDQWFSMLRREAWVVTASSNGQRSGLLATWLHPASLASSRPTLVVGLAPTHFTTELVEVTGRFAAHLLHEGQAELALAMASVSGREQDKLEGRLRGKTPAGCPQLSDCLAWLDCWVFHRLHAGDRVYFWAEVTASGAGEAADTGARAQPLLDSHVFAAADEPTRQRLHEQLRADVERLRSAADQWREGIA